MSNRMVFTLAAAISLVFVLPQDVLAEASVEQLKSAYKRPPEIPFPKDRPYSHQKAALGKALFFDSRLSGAENMNCGSCHNPSFGWEVPNKTAVGAQGTRLARQAPTVLDTAWRTHFFWDGRAATAEDQAVGPIQAAAEMNLPLPEAVKRLSSIPGYKNWFSEVYPEEGITPKTIAESIATFERTVVSSYAPFDAWVDGDEQAISESAKKGFKLFTGKAQCAECHGSWQFTDNEFHDIGTTQTDIGRGSIDTGNIKAQYAFKTPPLRDIAQRAPYMHNGEFPDLNSVVLHYVSGFSERPSLSPELRQIELSEQDVSDLIEFLRTLTGDKKVVTVPVLPN